VADVIRFKGEMRAIWQQMPRQIFLTTDEAGRATALFLCTGRFPAYSPNYAKNDKKPIRGTAQGKQHRFNERLPALDLEAL
jgi:hypothetical protein